MSRLDIKLPAEVLDRYRRAVLPGVLLVRSDSAKAHHNLVEKIAGFFNRETGWGLLYAASETYSAFEREAWLFINTDYQPCGACCFRKRTLESGQQRWHMHWIWLHPYARDKGLLKEALPGFDARYGDWAIEGPYSRTMRVFIAKNPRYDSYTPPANDSPLTKPNP